MSLNSWLGMHRRMRKRRATRIVCAAAAALTAITFIAPSASAAFINVYGPTYTPGVGGFKDGHYPHVNVAGTAVGYATKIGASGAGLGVRAIRWDGSGTAAVELQNLSTQSYANAINNAGTAVGYAETIVNSAGAGTFPVRWDAAGTAATRLAYLNNDTGVTKYSRALAINDVGTAVGYEDVYISGGYRGGRAVRWDASGVATELASLGRDASNHMTSSAVAINTAGTAIGYSRKYDVSGNFMGQRAVRWDASGTAATELGNLGTDAAGFTSSGAGPINEAGIIVGSADKYDASGRSLGSRAVRWNAGGTAATELGNLGTDASGFTSSSALLINDAGTIVGSANKYDATGVSMGSRVVRWDASGTAATELGSLWTDASGAAYPFARAINSASTIVGFANKYDGSGTFLGPRAVYWGLDDVAVDLNTLIDPASGWTLLLANDISDTGWITGEGAFDPDGAGGQAAYGRLFLMQVPAAVPEPATVVLFIIALLGLAAASRRRVRRSVIPQRATSNAGAS